MPLGSMTGLEWIPKITYTDCATPVTFTLRIPQAPWRYVSRAQGGRDVAASGVTESFVYRHDRGYVLTLRFTEEEWTSDVEPWLKVVHAQEQTFTVQLDADDAGTAHTVYLVSPVTGEDVSPTPNPFSGVLELQVHVRTSDGTALSGPYFPSLA